MTLAKRRLLTVLGLTGVCGAVACVLVGRDQPKTQKVQSGMIAERIMGRGVITPRKGVVDVRSLVDGRVSALHAREGDRVRAGQLLIELQPLGLDSEVQRLRAEKAALEASAHLVSTGARPDELAQLEAELTGARSELALALEELNDNQRLSETGSVAPLDLKRTSAWAAVKQARVATLEARLRLAREGATSAERRRAFERVSAADAALHRVREQLDWSRVVSPIDGVILTREVDVGDCAYSGPLGGVMLQIADVDNPEVRIEVEESDSLRVQAGLIVELHVSSGRAPSCRGKITRVSPRLESRAVGVPGARDRADALVRVAWADVDCARLVTVPAVGQRFDVDIWLPSVRAATMVPRSAVTIDDGLAQVEVKSRFGWQKMPVKLGTDDGEHVAVDGIPNDAFVRVRKSEGSR